MNSTSFNSALENELTMSEFVRSENGAIMHASTGKSFLDAFWKISSCRNIKNEDEIIQIFAPCFKDDFELACRMLFYIRDCRQGCGEKRTFNIIFNWLLLKNENAEKLIKLIPEYGSWKDIVLLADKTDNDELYNLIKTQLLDDIEKCKEGKSISLLAKWLPSVNTSSKKTVEIAKKFCKLFGYSQSEWRKILSRLRKHLDVIERKLCANQWGEVDYNKVPSKANLIYKNAFMKHDQTRRLEYLSALKKGDPEVKMNATVLEPYEIVHKYTNSGLYYHVDDATELLWKNLPRNVDLNGRNLICVHDNSGSMGCHIGGTNLTCHDVAGSIAIYCSELLGGDWKDKFITFSAQPKLVDLSNCDSLASKIGTLHRKMDCSNTNIEAVFNIILRTAIQNHSKPEEIPDILVVSDMEFDNATTVQAWGDQNELYNKFETLFETIGAKFREAGYELPKLIFWNICGRTGGIPIRENKNGVILVSGFSKNIFKMVASRKLDPFEALKEQLMNSRYDAVSEALKK